MSLIIAKNLVKEFNNKKIKNRVIKGINFSIDEGEFIAITGESGSGKSTLLYLLSGLDKPTSGGVFYMGKNLALFNDREMAELRRNEISFIYQFYNLIPNLTIYENIILPKRIEKRLSLEDKRYLKELLDFAKIGHIADLRPNEVSGGEQQRAAFIRSVFTRPKIIFADEPTGNLDSASGERLIDLIKDINSTYKTAIVMVTHSKENAKAAQRELVLKDGVIYDEKRQ
ncbi:MAG: ABC transporter ATP-binding protein [Christensenellales bacterium]